MQRLTLHEIREAIRQLPEDERQRLLDDLLQDHAAESPADMAALEKALDQADASQLIEDSDLEAYMAARREERKRGRKAN